MIRASGASVALSAWFAASAGAQQLGTGANTPARRDWLAPAPLSVMATRVPSPTIVLGQVNPDRDGRKVGVLGEGGVPATKDTTGARGLLALRPVIEAPGKVVRLAPALSRLWAIPRFALPRGLHR